MPNVQQPTTIAVEMEVTRFQEFLDDGLAQIWGYVGDYEVSVWISLDDPRVKTLKSKKRPAEKR